MRAGRQHDLRPGRRLLRPGIIPHDLLDDGHRLAFGDPRHHFALELGLAAHIDVAGHDHRRARPPAARSSAPAAGAFFFAAAFFCGAFSAFFFAAFFLPALAAGALVLAVAGASRRRRRGRAAFAIGAAGVGLVACCASKLVESIAPRINQQFFFITQHIRDLISGSVNVRHLPGRSSPSLIFPIWTRCNRFTVTRCDSNSRRTSRYLPCGQFQFHHALRLARRDQPRLFRLQLARPDTTGRA